MDALTALTTQCFGQYPKVSSLLAIIGLLIIIRKILKSISSIYKVILRPRRNFKRRYGENSWALITGSSDGIGKAFAFSLARQGFNIILSARTESKLQKVKQQLLQAYPQRQVIILPADYKKAIQVQYVQSLIKKVQDLDISILINNVGVDVLQYYHKLEAKQIADLIKINCYPCTLLSHQFIKRFLKRKQENKNVRSAIVNVASVAGELPMPLHNVYSASKAYIDRFSRAIAYEYPQIDIMSLRPSEVSTPMTFHKKTDIFTITAHQCSEGMLNDLGYQKETNGYWNHKLQSWIYEMIPERIFNYVWLNFIGPDFMRERELAMKKQ